MEFRKLEVSVSPKLRNFVSSNCSSVPNCFSSFVDVQNYVTSKPLLRSCCISNRWKPGRVVQLFGIHLMGGIPSKQPQNLIFLRTCNLPRISVSSKTGHRSKIVTPKPSTVWGRVKDQWKHERVLFDFGVQLRVEFHVEQSWCNFSLLLLLIKAKLP
jgi:hypothetical protein